MTREEEALVYLLHLSLGWNNNDNNINNNDNNINNDNKKIKREEKTRFHLWNPLLGLSK